VNHFGPRIAADLRKRRPKRQIDIDRSTAKDGDVRPSLEITALHVLALRQPKPGKALANEHERTLN
jgi:hypothetical protein